MAGSAATLGLGARLTGKAISGIALAVSAAGAGTIFALIGALPFEDFFG
jgi:hypothetical protein